jgi:hypothetical protein
VCYTELSPATATANAQESVTTLEIGNDSWYTDLFAEAIDTNRTNLTSYLPFALEITDTSGNVQVSQDVVETGYLYRADPCGPLATTFYACQTAPN